MTKKEKALIILKILDKTIQVDWNLEKYYLDAIVKGLEEIERRKDK